MKEKEFFIGWQADPPAGIGKFLKKKSILLLALAVVLGAAVPIFQNTVSGGRILFGKIQDFEGVLIAEPVPMLVLAEKENFTGQSIFILTKQLKNGFDRDLANQHNLSVVRMKGTLLHDGTTAMIEMVDGTFEALGKKVTAKFPPAVPLGNKTLKGEIVDAKCYLGMMNPGVLKGHRACAINCIRGGIPPLFLIRSEDGQTNRLIMTGPNGEAINEAILDYVAEPIEIQGDVSQCGEYLIIAIDPANIKRLS